MLYHIDFLWDADAAVWVATSEDVPGLVLEGGSFDALIERVKLAVPELIGLNGECKLDYATKRVDSVAVYGRV